MPTKALLSPLLSKSGEILCTCLCLSPHLNLLSLQYVANGDQVVQRYSRSALSKPFATRQMKKFFTVYNWKCLCKKTHRLKTISARYSKCGEWPYSFATFVANEKILLDIIALNQRCPVGFSLEPHSWLKQRYPTHSPHVANDHLNVANGSLFKYLKLLCFKEN